MRWLADECVAASLVAFLRSIEHDVLYVAESATGYERGGIRSAIPPYVLMPYPGVRCCGCRNTGWSR